MTWFSENPGIFFYLDTRALGTFRTFQNRNSATHLTMSPVNQNGKIVSARKKIDSSIFFFVVSILVDCRILLFKDFKPSIRPYSSFMNVGAVQIHFCVLNLHSQKWNFQAMRLYSTARARVGILHSIQIPFYTLTTSRRAE